jgi:hypothetical protein
MNKLLKPAALLGLAMTILPPLLLFVGAVDSLPLTKNIMLAGMILWYLAATPWLAFQKLRPSDREVEI